MTLEIQLLGSPQFLLQGQRLNFNRRKSIALLSYLAVTGRPQSRDALAALFWPEYDDSSARTNLRRDLSRLRADIPEDVLFVDRLQIEFNHHAGAQVDVRRFEAGLAEARQHAHSQGGLCDRCAQSLDEVVGLYQGEFMAGFNLPDCPEFDEWQFFQREQRRREVTEALAQLVAWCSAEGRYAEGIGYGRRWLGLDPWHEPAHRALMRLYALSGQQAAAQRQYAECVRLLEEALGIEPEEETVALNAAIVARKLTAKTMHPAGTQQPQDTPAQSTEPITEPTHKQATLPVAVTPLIGRQAEQAALTDLLTRPETRLVTITGPGGMGKTRLALALATTFQEQDAPVPFPDGVFFVELAALVSADFILPSLAQAVGVRLDKGTRQLVTFLRDKRALIVLDNFEHLLDGVSLVGELLKDAPFLTILVTSRERLQLQGEQIYPLGGLEIPHAAAPHAAAAELFLHSARRVRPGFSPTTADWADIIRICRLVEGMPLALELAGSWSDVLSPVEIASEITQSLDFLETELVDLPGRHRSVRAAITGSWEKLTPEQQRQLSRLSVLRGSFTRQAAEAIAGVSLRALTHLINKSFVGFNQQTKRYDIHALILKFAAEQLARDPAGKEQTAAAHARYFSEMLGEWRWFTPYQQIEATLDQIDQEIDNIRVMWQWVVAHEDIPRLYRGFTTLGRYFQLRGSLAEGITLFRSAAEMLAHKQEEAVLRGRLTAVLASLYRWQDNYEDTIATAREAIAIGRAADAPDVLALALFEWGYALWRRSLYDECREKLNEALANARRANIEFLEADVLRTLGLIHFIQGDLDVAEQMMTEALALFRDCQEIQGEALTFNNLGMVYSERKQMRRSAEYFKQSMLLHRQVKDRTGEARALTNLSSVESEMGQIVPAIEHSKQALAMHRTAGLRLGEAVNLGWLGKMYTDLGQFDIAGEHLYPGVALCAELGAKQDEINMLIKACHLEIQTGDYQLAYQTGLKTLMMAQEFEVMRQVPAAMNCCGHALSGLGEVAAAQEAFQDALTRLGVNDQAKARTEPQAGLARLALKQGHVEAALSYVEPILALITGRPLTGIFDAFGIYLTCYQVLAAAGDERAGGVLETAVKRLEAQAQQIFDYKFRASFLKKIPAHQALLSAYQAVSSKPAVPMTSFPEIRDFRETGSGH